MAMTILVIVSFGRSPREKREGSLNQETAQKHRVMNQDLEERKTQKKRRPKRENIKATEKLLPEVGPQAGLALFLLFLIKGTSIYTNNINYFLKKF